MKELIKELRLCADAYEKPPYGLEVEGTVELLREAAVKLAAYENLENRLYKQFNGCIEAETIINAIIEYDKQLERNEDLAEAMLITNDSVRKFREWEELEKQGKLSARWIPCSERMPEVEQDVLLSFRSLDVRVGYRANTEGYFYVYGEEYVLFENTLAWQPLPEPYKDSQQN